MSRSQPHPMDRTERVDGYRLTFLTDGVEMNVELISPDAMIQDVTLTREQARAVRTHLGRWLRTSVT